MFSRSTSEEWVIKNRPDWINFAVPAKTTARARDDIEILGFLLVGAVRSSQNVLFAYNGSPAEMLGIVSQ